MPSCVGTRLCHWCLPCFGRAESAGCVQVVVHYIAQDVDLFVHLADGIEEILPDLVVDGVELEAGGPHNWELRAEDGRLLMAGSHADVLPSADVVAAVLSEAER